MHFLEIIGLHIFLAIAAKLDAVQVTMQGSLSLGKDVLETVEYYLRASDTSGRRSLLENDNIERVVKSALLCKDLRFCEGEPQQFIHDYIVTFIKTLNTIFEAAIHPNGRLETDGNRGESEFLSESEIMKLIKRIKKVLNKANSKINEDNEANIWSTIMKKVSSNLQEIALNVVKYRLEGDVENLEEVKKIISQKIVISVAIVETTFEKKLCASQNICSYTLECTKALNSLLDLVQSMNDKKINKFISYVREALLTNNFYSYIDGVTAKQLNSVLNEMSSSSGVSKAEVFSSLHSIVKARLVALKPHTSQSIPGPRGKDVYLVNAILSDMDFLYESKKEPFDEFIEDVMSWVKYDRKVKQSVLDIIESIGAEIDASSLDVVSKLRQAVKVFLEVTLDPE